MKIGNNVESVQSDLLARAVNGSRNPSPTDKAVEAVESTDRIELSETTRSLSSPPGGTAQEGVRLEKVAEVRQAIQEGRFHVSAEAVADRMINEAAELIETITTGRGA